MAFDTTAASLGQEIERARQALIQTIRDSATEWWDARELKAAAKNGWSYGAGNLALSRLIEDGTFDAQKDKVRLNK